VDDEHGIILIVWLKRRDGIITLTNLLCFWLWSFCFYNKSRTI